MCVWEASVCGWCFLPSTRHFWAMWVFMASNRACPDTYLQVWVAQCKIIWPMTLALSEDGHIQHNEAPGFYALCTSYDDFNWHAYNILRQKDSVSLDTLWCHVSSILNSLLVAYTAVCQQKDRWVMWQNWWWIVQFTFYHMLNIRVSDYCYTPDLASVLPIHTHLSTVIFHSPSLSVCHQNWLTWNGGETSE